MIQISHLRKEYPLVTPLEDVTVDINDGEVISVIGPSGAGKTTFLRCLNMLETPTSGTIVVDGEEITAPGCRLEKVRQKMGMVFQSFNLFPHMNAIENIMYAPRKLLGLSEAEAYKRGLRLLDTVGLSDKERSYPDELSGGQKQRVAIARALAMEPKILLFDEPTSALDPTMVGEVLMVIRNLAKEGMTMVIVTHEMKFAKYVSDRILYMDRGGIYEEGTPKQIFENPQRELTRLFIRQIKVFEEDFLTSHIDFPSFASKLKMFVHRLMISKDLAVKIQLFVKELYQSAILPLLETDTSVHFKLEYADESDKADIILTWSGENNNLFDRIEEIRKNLPEKMDAEITHEWNEGKNTLKICL